MTKLFLSLAAAVAMTWPLFAATTQQPKTAKRKSPTASKSAPARPANAHTANAKSMASKSTAAKSATAKKSAAQAKSKSKSKAVRGPTRSAQQAPTPQRYQEIQQALASKGYFQGEANGKWGPDSGDALKRFQADQNLMPDGKINSLSLIAMGLGPKRLSAQSKPAATSTPAPAVAPQ